MGLGSSLMAVIAIDASAILAVVGSGDGGGLVDELTARQKPLVSARAKSGSSPRVESLDDSSARLRATRAIFSSGGGGSAGELGERRADDAKITARAKRNPTVTAAAHETVAADDGTTAEDDAPSHAYRRQLALGQCFDTDNGAADSYGDDCYLYTTEDATGWSSGWGNWCGSYDDSDFSSNDMCCVCGGGSDTASPTESPTLTNRPSISPAPTSSPTQVAVFSQIKNPVDNMEEGDELRFSLALDLTFPNEIVFDGDRWVQLAGDAANRPTLSGGGTRRFFDVGFDASLQLKYLVLADGYSEDAGGAIDVLGGTLVLIDCILRSCLSENDVRRLCVW